MHILREKAKDKDYMAKLDKEWDELNKEDADDSIKD